MMQWSNLTKCGLVFNIVSPAVHTLLPSVLQRLDSRIEAFILSSKKSSAADIYDLIIGPILLPRQGFFHVGEQKIIRWCQMSHTQQPLQPQTCVQEHCPGETGHPSSVSGFVLKCLYYSKSRYTYPEWVYLEGNNAFNIRKC